MLFRLLLLYPSLNLPGCLSATCLVETAVLLLALLLFSLVPWQKLGDVAGDGHTQTHQILRWRNTAYKPRWFPRAQDEFLILMMHHFHSIHHRCLNPLREKYNLPVAGWCSLHNDGHQNSASRYRILASYRRAHFEMGFDSLWRRNERTGLFHYNKHYMSHRTY